MELTWRIRTGISQDTVCTFTPEVKVIRLEPNCMSNSEKRVM